MTMNFLLTMAATAAPIATEAATPTGSRAGKILGILLAIVLLIGFLVIVIGWAVSKTKSDKNGDEEDEIEENSESFFEMPAEEELAIESELEFEFEEVGETEDDLASFFFKPKEPVTAEEIEVVPEEEAATEVKESFWNIPTDSTLTDSSGTKYQFYDYHKNDRTKLWGLASDDTMKLMALEDIVKIESEDNSFSTVKLARAILVIEGSRISYVDSLTGKSLPAHSTIKSKIRYETLPEGKVVEDGRVLGEIISSKVDYRSGGPAFFYQDENGTPRRKRFSEITTKLEIVSSNGNYFVERVIDSDMLCITSISAMMIIDVSTGIIVANSKS